MNAAALILGSCTVTWPGVFAVLGCVCAMLLAMGLWVLRGRRALALAELFPAAILLGLVLGRLCHWYCHPLQYPSLGEAMTDYFRGGFSLWGVFAGVLLSAVLLHGAGLAPDLWELLDVLAPAGALGIAVGRLGAMFDLSDRGKFVIQSGALHRLPFSVYTELSSQGGQWRFATFFWQSLCCLLTALALLWLLWRAWKREERGTAAIFFALLYGAGQILLDSTRYDADFFRFNGFIHVPQFLSALAAAAAIAVLGVRSIRRWGFRPFHGLLLGLCLACFGLCGLLEYLVQRYAERYALCYSAMALLLALLCAAGALLYVGKPRREASKPRKSGVLPGNTA